MTQLRLRVTLGAKAEVPLSYEERQQLGGGVRIPIAGRINGVDFRTTSFRMGDFTGIAFRKELQEAAGVEPGDEVELVLARDTAERLVDVPAPLAAALDGDPAAKAAYEAMSYTHRREYAEWIDEAKKDDTRERRVARALELLREGKPPRST